MRVPNFRNGNRAMIPFSYRRFKGYNVVDNNADLTPGQWGWGKNVDPSRVLGAIAKRQGLEALFASLGAGGVKGGHTYRRSSGDRILFGHGTALKRAEGNTTTLSKTTQADFDAGTLTQVSTTLTVDSVQLDEEEAIAGGYTLGSIDGPTTFGNYEFGWSFDVGGADILIRGLRFYGHGTGETKTLNLWSSAGVKLATVNVTTTANTWVVGELDAAVTLTAGQTYKVSWTSAGSDTEHHENTAFPTLDARISNMQWLYGTAGSAPGTANTLMPLVDIQIGGYYATGTWESPSYDMTNTPSTATLAWSETAPTGTTLTAYAKGSGDNTNWGDWQAVSASGAGIPLTRYVKVKFDFASPDQVDTPLLADFTITHEADFTTTSDVKTGLSGDTIRFVDYNDKCYFCEGGRPQVYDGTAVLDVGVDPPATAPTISPTGTGSITGAYYAKVTYVNDDGAESNASAASTVANASSDAQFDWSSIPTGPTGTAKRKLYRTKAGDNVYFFVATIEDNTTTTYTDTTPDGDLVTELETDNEIPPDSTIIAQYQDYTLYVPTANPERLVHSKAGLPDSTTYNAADATPTGYKPMPGPIEAVAVYDDKVVVGNDRFTRVIYGDIWGGASDNTTVESISDSTGPVSHESVKECFSQRLGNILVFPTRDGLHYLSPGVQENSLRSVPLSRNVQPYFDGAINLDKMAAEYYSNRYVIAVNYNDPAEVAVQTNNVVFSLDMRTFEWSSPWTISAAAFCVANGELYCGSSTIGRLFKMFSGTSDAGANILFKFGSAYYTSNRKVEFAHVRLHVRKGSTTDDLNLLTRVDDQENTVAVGATTNWPGQGGTSRSIQDEVTSTDIAVVAGEGYTFGFELSDDSTNDFVIYGLTGWHYPPDRGVY